MNRLQGGMGLQMMAGIVAAANHSLSLLRSDISGVKATDLDLVIATGQESIDFNFRGQPYRAVLQGRFADAVMGHSAEADKAVALGSMLDGAAHPVAEVTS